MGKICIVGSQVLISETLGPAVIEIDSDTGKIISVHSGTTDWKYFGSFDQIIDGGNENIVMPGIVDSHVHVNEPGRTEWEGFATATKAAAAGGITTLIDMPLNSIPPTTTVENLKTKVDSTKGKLSVDVGFWGGVVPGNSSQLVPMVNQGVVGFKCFLIHSGVDEFPSVSETEVDQALEALKGTNSVLAFHAEVDCGNGEDKSEDPGKYNTFLSSRPPKMELQAIEMVAKLCKKHGNVRCHIVHLSAAGAIPIIADLKAQGFPITVETCPHYLTLKAEEISDRSTEYKCCPPIRDAGNQDALWEALKSGIIDSVVSDHSPCIAELKKPGEKDFMEAWGGISSVQFGLSLIWTAAQQRGISVSDLSKWMTVNTSKLVGLDNRKGKIAEGYDADFVIWNPNETIKISEGVIQHKNKLSPYKGKEFKGRVVRTIVRGHTVYQDGKFSKAPIGQILLPIAE